MSEIIAEKLINIGSVQFSFNNHFTLTSGLKSPVYVDCRKIISFIDERDFIMKEAIQYFKTNNLQFDLIAGGETAGIPYAAIISEKIKKPMLYIRKKPKGFGKNQQIEGEFKERGGKKIRAITYTPDFIGDGFIIECKGRPNESLPLWAFKYKGKPKVFAVLGLQIQRKSNSLLLF